jgi:hypothetical protein
VGIADPLPPSSAEIHVLVRELTQASGLLAEVAARAQQVSRLDWASPAASMFRTTLQQHHGDLLSAAEQLDDAAARLHRYGAELAWDESSSTTGERMY